MYLTRPASLYRGSPEAAQWGEEGPGSGYLVLQDVEYEEQTTTCFGLCKDPYLKSLPFPQNRRLTVEYTDSNGEQSTTYHDSVYFIPVIDQPLSSHRYYVIIGKGKHQGEASTSSTEENIQSCCCCSFVKDVKPTSFDLSNIYQQVEILRYHNHKSHFYAKSVASDGFPVNFLRRKGWRVNASVKPNCQLGEASGINMSLRARLPDLSISYANTSSHVVVGKWYCPFIFVKEESLKAKDQLNSTMFYEMTLQQSWKEVYQCEKYEVGGNVVSVNVGVQSERPLLYGDKMVQDHKPIIDGFKWFMLLKSTSGGLGLSMAIVERMRWEQERGGWVDGECEVKRMEVYDGKTGWNKFRCLVLVERYVLKRKDGSLILAYDFMHTQKVRCCWE